MFRTSRMAYRGRAERATLRQMNLERDNPYRAESRADVRAGERMSKPDNIGLG